MKIAKHPDNRIKTVIGAETSEIKDNNNNQFEISPMFSDLPVADGLRAPGGTYSRSRSNSERSADRQ
jgi:hypothetical protein